MERFKEELLQYITIPLGFDCNNACIDCMIKGCREHMSGYTTLEKFEAISQEKSKMYESVVLSGGEITLMKDLPDYVRLAKKYWKHVRVQTNGTTLCDLDWCLKLIEAGMDEFYVTLNGHTEEIHDVVAGRKGAFRETWQGLKNLSGLGVRVITNTVILETNYRYLGGIVRAVASLGAVKEMDFCNYWAMEETDVCGLIPRVPEVVPYLAEALRLAEDNDIAVCVKDLPACLLKEDIKYLNNIQTPESLVGDIYWERFAKNVFGNCRYREECSHMKSGLCRGFLKAYINKFGSETKLLNPALNEPVMLKEVA